jgi:hypothetical protein
MAQGNVRRRARQTTQAFRGVALCLAGGFLLAAGGSGSSDSFSGVSLKVLNSSAPPGGTIQLTVTLTEPKPIVTAGAGISFDTGVLGPVMGVALYGPAGASSDAAGAAVPSGNALTVRMTSPSGGFGTDPAAPILAVTLGVRPDANRGSQSTLLLDPAASFWIDPLGQPYAQQVKSGTFEVAGTVSINDVFPGTGLLPAGSAVAVLGIGFQPRAIVEIDGVAVASTTFVSSSELDVTIGVAADLYGRRVTVRNPDLSAASYRAYLRAEWLGRSANPLLASTDPIFSPQTFTGAFFTRAPGPGKFLALALQNPAVASADVNIELRSPTAGSIASTTVTLPPRTRISRQVSEFFATQALPADGYLVVRSNSPVQMLGLLGDDAAGTVEPVAASLAFP